jgi:ribosomal protein S18 acetylase RimI-like enzyme
MSITSSLGNRAEYVISHLECERLELDEVVVIRTPSAPNFYFGNLLSLKIDIEKKTLEQWTALFDSIFSETAGVDHYTFTWPRRENFDANMIKPFIDANYKFDETHILSMERSQFEPPEMLNEDIDYRSIETDADWQQWTELNLVERLKTDEETGLRTFLQGRIQNYNKLSQEGLGEFLGAFKGETLIGYAGLYYLDGLARFQDVHVRPDFQNKKIAKTLLTKLIQRTSETVNTMVIVADENYHASKLYQSLGFTITERECSLYWWPGNPENTKV